MPGHDGVARALLALAPGARLDPATVSSLLVRLGLMEHNEDPVDEVSTLWDCTFGDRTVRIGMGAAANHLRGEAATAHGASLTAATELLLLEAHPTSDRHAVDQAQALCSVAALIGDSVKAGALYWQPAQLWSPTALLADAVTALESDGLPPVLHIIRFERDPADEGRDMRSLRTCGLGWLIGHELRLRHPSSYSDSDALRRATRLAIDAMVHRGLVGPMTVRGMEKGETLAIGAQCAGDPWPWVPVESRQPPS